MAGNVNLSGKIALITGATNGIGKATAEALAGMGATVIIVSRSATKCQQVVDEIKAKTGNQAVSFMAADLSSQQAIRELVTKFKSQYQHLHILVNNAGGVYMQRELTVDGLERTFAFNHLGYFLLTNLLLDTLKASAPARIISVSSGAHRGAKLNFDDLGGANGYSGFRSYGQSKLANILFTRELAKQLKGTGVTANCLHPGVVATGFFANNGPIAKFAIKTLARPFLLTPEKGALTSIYLASSPDVEGVTGEYFSSQKIGKPDTNTQDEAAAKRLWKVSEELTHLNSEPVSASA